MKTITLKNSFHNSSVRVRVPDTDSDHWLDLRIAAHEGDESAKRKVQRIRRTLCGSGGCQCGTVR